jgi:hypothetical protein
MAAAVVAGEVPRTGPLAEAQVHGTPERQAVTDLPASSALCAELALANSWIDA